MTFGIFYLLDAAYSNITSIKDDSRQTGSFSKGKRDLKSRPKEAMCYWNLKNTNAATTEIARIALVAGRTKVKAVNRLLFKGYKVSTGGRNMLRIEVKNETVLRLLKAGHICAADLNCLDCESKYCLRLLCLKSCICKPNAPECAKITYSSLYRNNKKFIKELGRLFPRPENNHLLGAHRITQPGFY